MGFLDNLRISNIFGGGGGGGFGPDLSQNSINQDEMSTILNRLTPIIKRTKDEDARRNLDTMKQQGRLQQLAGNMGKPANFVDQMMGRVGFEHMKPEAHKTINVPPPSGNPIDNFMGITPLQQATLDQRDTIAYNKDINQDLDRNIKQQRADTYSSMHDMSDSEKLEVINAARRGDIEARGMIQRELLETSGKQDMDQINRRGVLSEREQRDRGIQDIQKIMLEQQGRQTLQNTKPVDPMLPSQNKILQGNNAREFVAKNPTLAPFIEIAPDNTFTVRPPSAGGMFSPKGPSQADYDKIIGALYPGQSTTTTPAKPTKPATTTTPPPRKGNDPLGLFK